MFLDSFHPICCSCLSGLHWSMISAATGVGPRMVGYITWVSSTTLEVPQFMSAVVLLLWRKEIPF